MHVTAALRARIDSSRIDNVTELNGSESAVSCAEWWCEMDWIALSVLAFVAKGLYWELLLQPVAQVLFEVGQLRAVTASASSPNRNFTKDPPLITHSHSQGLEEVLLGMAPGSKRRVLIPPEVGYVGGGEQPQPPTFGTKRQLETHRRWEGWVWTGRAPIEAGGEGKGGGQVGEEALQ